MSKIYYIEHIDDEDYPFWIGREEQSSTMTAGQDWCEQFAQRGYDFYRTHDAFNGSHMLFKFISRTDAMRFLLQE